MIQGKGWTLDALGGLRLAQKVRPRPLHGRGLVRVEVLEVLPEKHPDGLFCVRIEREGEKATLVVDVPDVYVVPVALEHPPADFVLKAAAVEIARSARVTLEEFCADATRKLFVVRRADGVHGRALGALGIDTSDSQLVEVVALAPLADSVMQATAEQREAEAKKEAEAQRRREAKKAAFEALVAPPAPPAAPVDPPAPAPAASDEVETPPAKTKGKPAK